MPARSPLKLVKTIPLPAVTGRIDHMAADLERHRLFLAAVEQNAVHVVDIDAGQVAHSLTGFQKPQGLLFLRALRRLFVASGEDGSVKTFDGTTLVPSRVATVSPGADAIGYDPARDEIYVGSGGGDAGKKRGDLTIFDAVSLRATGAISTDAHAGGTVFEQRGSRGFVLVPESGEVVVFDRATRVVLHTWTVPAIQKNVAIALDERSHRIFLGVRTPPSIVVLDSENGRQVSAMPTVATLDGLWFDRATRRIYTSGGEGFLDVTQEVDADRYQRIARLETAVGARTSLFVPAWGRLFVALPRREGRSAELRVFAVMP